MALVLVGGDSDRLNDHAIEELEEELARPVARPNLPVNLAPTRPPAIRRELLPPLGRKRRNLPNIVRALRKRGNEETRKRGNEAVGVAWGQGSGAEGGVGGRGSGWGARFPDSNPNANPYLNQRGLELLAAELWLP